KQLRVAASIATGKESIVSLENEFHLLILRLTLDHIDQSANRNPGRTLRAVRFRFIRPGCSGNVEMRPRHSIREFFEISGGGNCARFPPTDVFNVRDVRLYLPRVLGVQGQLPE